MTEDTLRALRVARTRLKFELHQIEAALISIDGLLGGTGSGDGDREAAPSPARPASPRRRTPRPAARRAKTPTTKTPAKSQKASIVVMEAPDEKPTRPEGEARELALRALKAGPATVRECATRVRLNGESGYQRMWWALKALVGSGEVEKHGPNYQLVKAHGEAA